MELRLWNHLFIRFGSCGFPREVESAEFRPLEELERFGLVALLPCVASIIKVAQVSALGRARIDPFHGWTTFPWS